MMLTLRELLQERGLTQQELLQKLKWMPPRLSRYVTGNREMGPEEAQAIAKATSCRPVIKDGKILFDVNSERRRPVRTS